MERGASDVADGEMKGLAFVNKQKNAQITSRSKRRASDIEAAANLHRRALKLGRAAQSKESFRLSLQFAQNAAHQAAAGPTSAHEKRSNLATTYDSPKLTQDIINDIVNRGAIDKSPPS